MDLGDRLTIGFRLTYQTEHSELKLVLLSLSKKELCAVSIKALCLVLCYFLEHKTYVKCLGVLLDDKLSWKPHIDHICTKISEGIGIIARLRHFVPF